MVTDEKISNTALARYRLGSALIWLGVTVWLPFIGLRLVGEKPSLFWFLPFHLIGVISGARLRANARKELGIALAKKSILQLVGHGMIFLGILVWTPYFYLKVVHQSVEVMDYLPYHLLGVFGGAGLLVVNMWLSKKTS
ncbi:MAG: hypothetical protein EDM79_10650 [Chloroflexi bacterium]|nr:MAG: hypothetical protein EDM79_10650 [Chloroflexota bacterium]MCE7858373.1 hypothetical protein [Chloroflexi bacterium CFX2]